MCSAQPACRLANSGTRPASCSPRPSAPRWTRITSGAPCADSPRQPDWASRGRHANCVTPSSASPVRQACHRRANRGDRRAGRALDYSHHRTRLPEGTEASSAHGRDRYGRATRGRTVVLILIRLLSVHRLLVGSKEMRSSTLPSASRPSTWNGERCSVETTQAPK